MILNYFKRFNHIHLRPLIQTLSIANRSIIISFEPISIVVFNGALPHAAGSLLPSVLTDGLKIRRQSLFLCGR